MTLYMFRTVFPSINRSSRLYKQQQVFVKQILLSAILEWNSTCFGRSFRTSSGITDCTYSCQTDTAVCTVLNCWWWKERPSETCRVSNLMSLAILFRVVYPCCRLQPPTRIPLQPNHTESPTHVEPRTIRQMWYFNRIVASSWWWMY